MRFCAVTTISETASAWGSDVDVGVVLLDCATAGEAGCALFDVAPMAWASAVRERSAAPTVDAISIQTKALLCRAVMLSPYVFTVDTF